MYVYQKSFWSLKFQPYIKLAEPRNVPHGISTTGNAAGQSWYQKLFIIISPYIISYQPVKASQPFQTSRQTNIV